MQQSCQLTASGQRQMSIRRLWGPVSLMVVVSLFSGSAGVQLGGWSFVGIDKLAHLVVFGLLAVAWLRVFQPLGLRQGQLLFVAIGLTTGFGLLDEWHQYLNPLRSFEWADLAADFTGATLAVMLYVKVAPLQSLLEVKIWQVARLRSSGNDPN